VLGFTADSHTANTPLHLTTKNKRKKMKVNKRIGKLKQWTGEKLGGQQKTELSEDFQSLEQDVELRKAGVEKMYSVSKEFSKHLTRKFEAEGTDTGKVLPIDGLGLVFANHGDEFGSDSSFGTTLTSSFSSIL